MAKKKVAVVEPTPNMDNVTKIIEIKLKWLKRQEIDGINHDRDFGKEVAGLLMSGIFAEADLIATQEHGLRPGDVMDVSIHIKHPERPMTYSEALKLGHKVQFIYISYHQSQGINDGMTLFRRSMKPHEEAIDAIYNGTYDPTKLAVLEALPEVEEWDHKLGADAYHKIF